MHVRADLAHRWDVSVEEACAIQVSLAPHVVVAPLASESVRLAAGVDVAYSADGDRAWAAAVVMDRTLRVVEETTANGVPDRDYRTGLLAFREGRLTLDALLALGSDVDVILLDGHGAVHERGLGLASHVGVLLGTPAIGCPKTQFHAVDDAPDERRGSVLRLTKEWGAQGAALRLRTGVKPAYVSPGHLTDLDSAVGVCLAWSTGRRKVPEPLAAAHTLSVRARNDARG